MRPDLGFAINIDPAREAAYNAEKKALPLSTPQRAVGDDLADLRVGNEPIFSAAEQEQLAWRRFNPLSSLSALTLSAALDAFDVGLPQQAARLWAAVAQRDETIASVKAKREEAVALRDWTVVAADDSPAAADQKAALDNFYRSFRAGHSLNRHVVGGFPLLVMQMMESVSFGYTPHHFIWQPDAARRWQLPSGKTVPTLSCQAEYVPLEFFECRTGELRFLGLNQGITGTPLEPGAWMITTGPALMIAASILHWYKRLATHDLVNFSEKFGTPGLVIHTTAAQGSTEGVAARELARSMASNYRGVMYGAPENKVEVVWPSGGTGSGNLPMTGIIEDMRRQLAILYLGADLSTMSKGSGVGASVQGDEQAKRERSDCARVSETLNLYLDPLVLRWYFGPDAPVLAKVLIESPENEDLDGLTKRVESMVGMGAKVPILPVAKRVNIPVKNKDEDCFTAPPKVAAPLTDPTAATATATNAAPARQPRNDKATLGPLFAQSRVLYADAFANDLRPLTDAIKHVLDGGDDDFEARAEKLYNALPHLGSQIIAANGSTDALEKILGAAVATGITADPTNPPTLEDEN